MSSKTCVLLSSSSQHPSWLLFYTFYLPLTDAKEDAALSVREYPDWGVVLEQIPDSVLTNGLGRLIVHQVDQIPLAEPMTEAHSCEPSQKGKYDTVFQAANAKFIKAVKAELGVFMGTFGDQSTAEQPAKMATWKDRVLEDFLLCDAAKQIKCKFFPVLAPKRRVEDHEERDLDYIMVPCSANNIGSTMGCPRTHEGTPTICCARILDLNRKKCPVESMLHALDLVRSWHNSNLDDIVPFGPNSWDYDSKSHHTSFTAQQSSFHEVQKAEAYCLGLTDLYAPTGHERIGDSLVIPAQGYPDFNGRPGVRIHLSSKWHGQSANVDVFSHEGTHRRRRSELLPLIPVEGSWEKLMLTESSGDGDVALSDDEDDLAAQELEWNRIPMEDFLENEYETSPPTTRTMALDTYAPPEEDENSELLPLAPPTKVPLNPIGVPLEPPPMNLWGKVNSFWTDEKDSPEPITSTPNPTQRASTTETEASPTPHATLQKPVTDQQTTVEYLLEQTINSTPPPKLQSSIEGRELQPPKFAEEASQPHKTRAKSRSKRGWYGFLTKLGFLGLSPKYTDDLVSNLQKIEDVKIDELSKALAANTAGLLKVQTLGTRIKSVREDFCQSQLSIYEDSVIERLEMKLDDTLASLVAHMELCNQGVVPLSVPESNLVRICQSLTDSPVCSSTAIRSLFFCKVDGLNIVGRKIVTGYDIKFQIPISDNYRISRVTVLPIFSDKTKTINLQQQEKSTDNKSTEPNSLEKLGIAVKEVLESQKRGRRSTSDQKQPTLNLHRVHKVANNPFIVIETTPGVFEFAIQNENDCTNLPNEIILCEFVKADRLDNCWTNILNNKHMAATQTCRGSEETTEKSCFIEKLYSGYAISSRKQLDIINEETNTRRNNILQKKDVKVCDKFCVMKMTTAKRTLSCDQHQVTTDILEGFRIDSITIADDETSIDLSNLRPVKEEDAEISIGVDAIDNLLNQALKPSKVKSHLKTMTIVSASILGFLILGLALYCTWKYLSKLIPFPFRVHKPTWKYPNPSYPENAQYNALSDDLKRSNKVLHANNSRTY